MKLLWLSIICLFLNSCAGYTNQLLRNTENKLTSTQTLSYQIENVTIEGQASGDTIYTATFAFFQKSDTDTILGYNFLTESSLIHPRFLIPIVLRDHYDGNELTWTLESQVRNERTVTDVPTIDPSEMERKVAGHLPMLIDMLNEKGFEKISYRDTTINDKHCKQYNFYCDDDGEHQLFVSKKERLPVLLRIIISSEQPFIQEYYYSDFIFSDTAQFPSLPELSEDTSKEILPLAIGENFPAWELQTISGDPFHFGDQQGTAQLIFLSGIYCGACQLQIPITRKIYEEFSLHKDLNIIGFYPYDNKARLSLYAEEKQIPYPVIYNSLQSVEERYELFQKLRFPIPTLVLLDKNHTITWIQSGFNPDYADAYFVEAEQQILKVCP